NHLRRKLFEALSLASCIPALDDEVAALLIAVFAQALEQGVIKTLMSMGNKSHPPHIARVLRECIERPRRCCAAEQRDELAAPHVGHGPSSCRGVTTSNRRDPIVRSVCRTAAGKSLGQT